LGALIDEKTCAVNDGNCIANRCTVFRLSGFPAGTRKPDRLNHREIHPDGSTLNGRFLNPRFTSPFVPFRVCLETGHSVHRMITILFVEGKI